MQKILLQKIRSKNYETNLKRHGKKSKACICCGKFIKNINEAGFVHLFENSYIVDNKTKMDSRSYGFCLIGPECKKYLPKNFIF